MAHEKPSAHVPATTETAQHLRELVEPFETAMLVTLGDNGLLHARPMALADVGADGRLVFATAWESKKFDEVHRDERASVTFQSRDRYLAIAGYADTRRDRARIDQLWNDDWIAWFPRGRDDPDLCLLEVFPTSAELWDIPRGVRTMFSYARKVARGEAAVVHENLDLR